MSHKSRKVVTKNTGLATGVLIRDYEEDSRGRRIKSKPYRKPKATPSRIDPLPPAVPQEDPLFSNFPAAPTDWDGVELLDYNMEFDPDEGPSTSRKTPNQNLIEWLNTHFDEYLSALFGSHAAPPLPLMCTGCSSPQEQLYSCDDCVGHEPLCTRCMISAHRRLPTHRITRWNGTFWETTTLSAIGFVLELGHKGNGCELQNVHSTLLVGDLSGLQHLNVRYCAHQGCPSKSVQLLSAGLFPCSDDSPQSAFTLALLDHYELCSTVGSMSARKFYNILAKKSNAAFPDSVPDRYRELHNTHRRRCHLKNVKRSGKSYRLHPLEKGRQDHAIQCMCCPIPEFNYNPEDVCDDDLPFFRIWISYDGNFQNSWKNKKVDQDDISLSDGLQYFVEHKPYEVWAKAGGKERKKGTKPECDNHKAGRSDTYGLWGGVDVTGVCAFTCTRHTVVCAQGMCDYYRGEKFRFGDYAFGSVVRYKSLQGPCAFGMTYDIICQWIVNLKKRAAEFPPQVGLPGDLDLIVGMPKWHLVGHKLVCAILYSLNYMRYTGRIDREGPERFWSYLNETAGSTSEKSPGYRRDSINNIVDSWNFAKLVGAHKRFIAGFREAKKMLVQQKEVFDDLDRFLSKETTVEWANEPVHAMLNSDGKWRSPFHLGDDEVASFQRVLRQEREKESNESHSPVRRPGVVQWVAVSVELESQMQTIRKLGDELGTNMTDTQSNALSVKKAELWRKILAHQKGRLLFMGSATGPDHPERRQVLNAEPEHAELGLPSSFRGATLTELGLSLLVDLELTLCKAFCDEALQDLRDLLGTRSAELQFKKQNLRGKILSDLGEAKLRDQTNQLKVLQWRYNNSRAALLRLDIPDEDLRHYRQVNATDLKYLQSYLDDESGGLGQGHREIPWIWRSSVAPDDPRWHAQALKVEWFRLRERYLRWEEELKFLKRDVALCYNSFRSLEEIWAFKSTDTDNKPGMSEYAAKTSDMYRRLAEQVYDGCILHILDPVVKFQWAEEINNRSRGDTGSTIPLSPA